MDEKTSSLVGALLIWLLVGVVVTLLGARDLFEAWTEDCLVGTELQRCTEGQGRVMFGVGSAIIIPSVIGLVVTLVRRRPSPSRRDGGGRFDGRTSGKG